MRVLTFQDFEFSAYHSLTGHSESAAHPHWHAYVVRLWFTGAPDQDELRSGVATRFSNFHGADLRQFIAESTDENIAVFFLEMMRARGCVRVRVTNDGRRGAEVEA